MSTKKPIDKAKPTLRTPKKSDAAVIAATTTTMTAMKASPLWNANPTLQTSANALNDAATALATNAGSIADLRKKLAIAVANQTQLRRNWSDALDHTLATVSTITQGSADQVHELGLDVRTRAPKGTPKATPAGFAPLATNVAGTVIVHWLRGDGNHGFVVQHATDITNPATISVSVPVTKTKYTLSGLASGSLVHVRVAAIDPASAPGQSAWTDWVAAQAK
jgi:hypothetical protein